MNLAPENASRAMDALEAAGLRPVIPVAAREFANPTNRAEWVRDKNMIVFSLRDPDFPIRQVDVFLEHPMDFEEMWRESSETSLGDELVRFASIRHLMAVESLLFELGMVDRARELRVRKERMNRRRPAAD